MSIDLILLAWIAAFAVWGAFSGAARQIATLGALLLAFFCAKPLGKILAPHLAAALHGPRLLGVLLGSLLVLIAVMTVVRYALAYFFRRLFAGGDPQDRATDRWLGASLGTLKITALLYVFLSALTFVEDNVTMAGRRIGVSPHGSIAFDWVRRHNLFDYSQFSPAKDLVSIAKAWSDPRRASALQKDPAFMALHKDPRFQRALKSEPMRKAIETGDLRSLLHSNEVLDLIEDPTTVARLSAAASSSDLSRNGPTSRSGSP